MTGTPIAGHVFWDADVFVLPLAALRPAAARAMLEYRLRRLPAARAEAAALGRPRARASPGSRPATGRRDPPRVTGSHGEVVPIATGPHEEHIVGGRGLGRRTTRPGPATRPSSTGRGRLVVDTARYWASRIRRRRRRGHLYGVMGPDEYHPVVDDNAFTNVMARWNLAAGAPTWSSAGPGETRPSPLARRSRDGLVDGCDPDRRLYEQFAGYFDLEPLLMPRSPRRRRADVVLGPERVAGSQIIKQADVLMLHHLVPEEVAPGLARP